jgi:hypothetical protein
MSKARMRFLIRLIVRTSRLFCDSELTLDLLDSDVISGSRCDCLRLSES